MKKFRLLPLLVLVVTVVPFLLFLVFSASILKKSLKNSVVNDPQSALSQSLGGLTGSFNQAFNRNFLAALQFSGKEPLRKSLSGPVSSGAISALGQLEAKSSQLSLIVITDIKGNVLYGTLDIPLSTPSPTPLSSISKKKKPKSKTKDPLYANIKSWQGMDRALTGSNASGILPYQGTSYLVSMVPVLSHGKNLGVVLFGTKVDGVFMDSLKSVAVNEVAFYSQGQTLCTKPGPVPSLDYQKLSPADHPSIQWQQTSCLAGGIPLLGLDGKTAGFLAVFQPIKQTLTVEGAPQKDLLKAGFLILFLTVLLALALLWQFMVPFNRLLAAMDQIKKGDFNLSLPSDRPDELGYMAHSLKEMVEGLREKDRISLILGKVVDPQAAKKILAEKDYFSLKGERRECTLLQADLKAFNTLSENMTPEALVEALNQYFSIINEVVFKYEGMLDKFIGDTAIAVWGAPFTHGDKEARAIKAALEIQEALKDFNISRIKKGHPPFTVGIGIHTGTLVSGNLGSDKHYDYSIIGEPLHVVSRLCSMAAPGQTVVSVETYEKVRTLVKANPLNPIAVKGSLEPLKTFEVTPLT